MIINSYNAKIFCPQEVAAMEKRVYEIAAKYG